MDVAATALNDDDDNTDADDVDDADDDILFATNNDDINNNNENAEDGNAPIQNDAQDTTTTIYIDKDGNFIQKIKNPRLYRVVRSDQLIYEESDDTFGLYCILMFWPTRLDWWSKQPETYEHFTRLHKKLMTLDLRALISDPRTLRKYLRYRMLVTETLNASSSAIKYIGKVLLRSQRRFQKVTKAALAFYQTKDRDPQGIKYVQQLITKLVEQNALDEMKLGLITSDTGIKILNNTIDDERKNITITTDDNNNVVQPTKNPPFIQLMRFAYDKYKDDPETFYETT